VVEDDADGALAAAQIVNTEFAEKDRAHGVEGVREHRCAGRVLRGPPLRP
jgi:hypothetical protein